MKKDFHAGQGKEKQGEGRKAREGRQRKGRRKGKQKKKMEQEREEGTTRTLEVHHLLSIYVHVSN